MNVNIKKDENGEHYIDGNDLVDLFDDIGVIDHYTITELDEGQLMLEFFDINGEKVFPKIKK